MKNSVRQLFDRLQRGQALFLSLIFSLLIVLFNNEGSFQYKVAVTCAFIAVFILGFLLQDNDNVKRS